MKTILITGGAGFIGSSISLRLMKNYKVIIYDNFTRNSIKYLALNKNIKVIKGDINDFKKLSILLKKVDIVIHAAAIAGVSSYYNFPMKVITTNFNGTNNLLNCIKLSKKTKFMINFSTSEIYGDQKKSLSEIDMLKTYPPNELRSVYAKSKILSEQLCYCFSLENKFNIVTLRPFNIYGPGQVGEGAIANFIDQALTNMPLFVTNKGLAKRAWCFIDDFSDVVEKIIINYKKINFKNNFEYFNIGNPDTLINTKNLANKIIKLSKSKSKINYIKHIGTDINFRSPDIKKIKTLLKIKPKVSLDAGILKTINWSKNII